LKVSAPFNFEELTAKSLAGGLEKGTTVFGHFGLCQIEHWFYELRRLQRQRARSTRGSRQYAETVVRITRLHAEVAHIRHHTIHVFTTSLAMTHGVIVVEGLDTTLGEIRR